jgi:hypothetical protein
MNRRALAVFAAALLLALTGLAPWPREATGNPLVRAALSAAEEFTVEADVIEQLPAGGYLYLRVVEHRREHWVATLASTAPKGARRVRLQVFGRARDFHSARLGRDFAELWFAAAQPAVEEGAVP